MSAYALCPECGKRVDLIKRPIPGEMPGEEMFDHLVAEHPDKIEVETTPSGAEVTSVPFFGVEFD